jgi:hypothetical protein
MMTCPKNSTSNRHYDISMTSPSEGTIIAGTETFDEGNKTHQQAR